MRGTGADATRLRTTHRRAASLLLSGVAIVAAGCGTTHSATPEAQRLQRADLVAACRALTAVEPSVASEVAAAKAAWPLIAHGLPATTSNLSHAAIHTATERAAALRVPGLFEERQAASLTGRGSRVAALFRTFTRLAMRGWQLISAAIKQIEHGAPVGARFARANVGLYIESVYDAHFTLAQIGKQLQAGYKNLGGATKFGISLTPAEVDGLTRTYSEANARLYPHTGVRFGS